MALIALVYKRAPGSTIELAKLLFFVIIPVFVIGPIAGVYVDRWDRKRVMIISDVLRGILVLSIPFFILFFKRSFIPVYILTFLTFSITRFFLPSKMAIIPDIVSKDMLLVANTLSDTTRMIATFIGLAVAGIMVERIGAIKGFYIDAFTFFISALFISNMVVKRIIFHFKEDILMTREAIKKALRRSVWAEIKEGIQFVFRKKEMRFVAKTFFFLMAGMGAVSCVIIVFIQEAFRSATKDLSLLAMLVGLGALLGMMAYGWFGQKIRKEKLILFCILLSGVFLLCFAFATEYIRSFWVSAVAMVLLGFSSGPIVVSLHTVVHESIPQQTRGRIFSSLEAVIHLAFLVFMFIAALAAERIGRVWILGFCGFSFLTWGTAGIVLRRNKVWIK